MKMMLTSVKLQTRCTKHNFTLRTIHDLYFFIIFDRLRRQQNPSLFGKMRTSSSSSRFCPDDPERPASDPDDEEEELQIQIPWSPSHDIWTVTFNLSGSHRTGSDVAPCLWDTGMVPLWFLYRQRSWRRKWHQHHTFHTRHLWLLILPLSCALGPSEFFDTGQRSKLQYSTGVRVE